MISFDDLLGLYVREDLEDHFVNKHIVHRIDELLSTKDERAKVIVKKINQYLQDNYAFIQDLDYKETKASYNFKTGAYGKRVSAKNSKDTTFYVSYYGKGRIEDTFVGDVQHKFNTYTRLEKELTSVVKKIMQDQFPYETDMIIAGFSFVEEANKDQLSLDMNLDVSKFSLDAYLTVYVFSNDISYEILRDRTVEIDQLMKNHSLMFKMYSVVIEKPRKSEEPMAREALYLYDFPADKVISDNLIKVIQEHQVRWENAHEKEMK